MLKNVGRLNRGTGLKGLFRGTIVVREQDINIQVFLKVQILIIPGRTIMLIRISNIEPALSVVI